MMTIDRIPNEVRKELKNIGARAKMMLLRMGGMFWDM